MQRFDEDLNDGIYEDLEDAIILFGENYRPKTSFWILNKIFNEK